jgi:hypothetical protein
VGRGGVNSYTERQGYCRDDNKYVYVDDNIPPVSVFRSLILSAQIVCGNLASLFLI